MTNPEFWDCDCATDYIHPKSIEFCNRCQRCKYEQPDSMESEVEALIGQSQTSSPQQVFRICRKIAQSHWSQPNQWPPSTMEKQIREARCHLTKISSSQIRAALTMACREIEVAWAAENEFTRGGA